MENFLHPTLKYPAAPKIPSSVDATKYPAWSSFGHGTAWDNYNMENFLHPTLKTLLLFYSGCPAMDTNGDTDA